MRIALLAGLVLLPAVASGQPVKLDVPLVKQEKGKLCGPACIEMVLRFFKETRHDQYVVAKAIARKFAKESRFADSSFDPAAPVWSAYPGTPAYVMNRFLKPVAKVENETTKAVDSDPQRARAQFQKRFDRVRELLRRGVPVIVHQYWKKKGSGGHFRVVTGYDDARGVVTLNDPQSGAIEQTYTEFFAKWSVEGRWLPFWYLAFNTTKAKPPFTINVGAGFTPARGRG